MRVNGRPGSIAAAAHEELRDGDGARVLDRIATYDGSAHGEAHHLAAADRLQVARKLGFDRLLCEHRREWASRWEDADVRIDGDPELQLATRFAIFHLPRQCPGAGRGGDRSTGTQWERLPGTRVLGQRRLRAAVPRRDASARAARALLEYRLRRLPVAMRTARAQGPTGARFPWESAGSGRDVTPARMRDGRGELRPVLTGPLEQHIVADVAWAAGLLR